MEIGESARRGNAGSRPDDENDEFVSGIGERAHLGRIRAPTIRSTRVQMRRRDARRIVRDHVPSGRGSHRRSSRAIRRAGPRVIHQSP